MMRYRSSTRAVSLLLMAVLFIATPTRTIVQAQKDGNKRDKKVEQQITKIIPRSVTKEFPICKRYADRQRQRTLVIKGAEPSSSSSSSSSGKSPRAINEDNVYDEDVEEKRLLRRRQGNPIQGAKKQTSRTTSRGQQQKQQRGNGNKRNRTKNQQQKQQQQKQGRGNGRTNQTRGSGGNGRGRGRPQGGNSGRLKTNNRQGNNNINNKRKNGTMKQRNSGGGSSTTTKKQQSTQRGSATSSSSSHHIGANTIKARQQESGGAVKSRKKKRTNNVKRTRNPDEPPEQEPEESNTFDSMGQGQSYKPNIGYYPELEIEICKSDGSYPNYMKTDVQFYFSTTINECCRLHFKGSIKDCLEVSMKYAKKTEWNTPQGWGPTAKPQWGSPSWGKPPGPPGTGVWGNAPELTTTSKAPGMLVDAWGKPYEPNPALQTPGSSSGWQQAPPKQWGGAPGWPGGWPHAQPKPQPPLPANGGKPIRDSWSAYTTVEEEEEEEEEEEVPIRSSTSSVVSSNGGGKAGKSGGSGYGGGGSSTNHYSGGKSNKQYATTNVVVDATVDDESSSEDTKERVVVIIPGTRPGLKAPPPAWQAPPAWKPSWKAPPPIKCNKWGGGGWAKPCTYMPTYIPTCKWIYLDIMYL